MKILFFAMLPLFVSIALSTDQPELSKAKIDQRSSTKGLEGQVQSTIFRQGAVWVGYSEPSILGGQATYFSEPLGEGKTKINCGGLGKMGGASMSFESNASRAQRLKPPPRFLIFMQAAHGEVENVSVLSSDCELDGDGMTVYWLNDVKPRESITFLTKLIENGITKVHGSQLEDNAIAAIAMHGDLAANQVLEKLMTSANNEHIVDQATFWAGYARAGLGYELISAELARTHDPRFRKSAVFALYLNSDARALEKLIELARHDSSPEIRGESLFWLAHEAGEKAIGVVADAVENDSNMEVKLKAVFALSMMPDDEGIPLLINEAKNNANPAVRKDAIFWLGESSDPRALDFIVSMLDR